MAPRLFRTGEVLQALRVPHYVVTSILRSGKVSGPVIVAGRRLWTADDAEDVARILRARGRRVPEPLALDTSPTPQAES